MKLYVASSWRNPYQQNTVALLRSAGHEVYDFMHPPGGDHLGFSWAEVDEDWQRWNAAKYLDAIEHPIAVAGFDSDFSAMQWADAGVLVLPCGRSAHLEAGWFVGAGKPLWIVLDEAEFPAPGGSNPELMYRMATGLVQSASELLDALRCPVRSSITEQPCELPAGHEPWRQGRLHRYSPSGEQVA
jgi:hypothetical protein